MYILVKKFTNLQAVVAIFLFKVSGFWSHLRPAIFSCAKQRILLLDIANWCVLLFSYLISLMYYLIMNTLACSAKSSTVYCTVVFFSLFPYGS